MTGIYLTVVGLALIVGLLGMLVVGLLRTQAELIRRLDSLGIRLDDENSGAPITLSRHPENAASPTEIVGTTASGEPVVKSLSVGTDPILVAFLSTTCNSCAEFWNAFDTDELKIHAARYRVVTVTLGPNEESPTRAKSLMKGDAEVVMSSEAWTQFEVPGAPYFAVVDPTQGSIIGEGTAGDMNALSTFLSDASGDRRWDKERTRDRTDADREQTVDEELKRAGLYPGDPRLHHGDEIGEADAG